MKLIVGLGNPGIRYAHTRHNIGFQVVRALAKDYGVKLRRDSATFSLSAQFISASQQVLLALPLTFMNLSGRAVGALVEKYKINLNGLLVICDDLDLEFDCLKIRARGSSGGHHGLESVSEALGTVNFSRLRLGIGRPREENDCTDYVLSEFTRAEKRELPGFIDEAVACSRCWVEAGIDKCMNIYNRKKEQA